MIILDWNAHSELPDSVNWTIFARCYHG